MKRKISFPGSLLPFRNRLYLKKRSVNSGKNRTQSYWAWALLILWLLVFLLINLKNLTILK